MHLEAVFPGAKMAVDEPGALPLLLCYRSMYGSYMIKLIRLGCYCYRAFKKAPNVLVGDVLSTTVTLVTKTPKNKCSRAF